MKKKNEIINKFKKLVSTIKEHNNHYFLKDSPIISDQNYDQIKKEAIYLEKKYPYLQDIESVSKIVGAKPLNKFKKIKHLSPMLSLSNAFDLKDMEDFLKKIRNFLNLKNK